MPAKVQGTKRSGFSSNELHANYSTKLFNNSTLNWSGCEKFNTEAKTNIACYVEVDLHVYTYVFYRMRPQTEPFPFIMDKETSEKLRTHVHTYTNKILNKITQVSFEAKASYVQCAIFCCYELGNNWLFSSRVGFVKCVTRGLGAKLFYQ